MRILYDSHQACYKSPFGTLSENEPCHIRLDIPESCGAKAVQLRLFSENGEPYAAFFLQKDAACRDYGFWRCSFSLAQPGLYFYEFYIETADGAFSLYKEGEDQTNMCCGSRWQVSCLPRDFCTPPEVAGKIMYQIFPDRFEKEGSCDLTGKLQPYRLHTDPKEPPDFLPDEQGVVRNNDFYGGNLRGIVKRLPYLAQLGVQILYLNPIFKAYSNHRYDTADYRKIDEMLGTEADFIALCDAAHRRGMRVILDGVFSHTGSNSVYFDRENIFGNGAYHHPDSPYRSWYEFTQYPEQYVSWWGIRTLPCVHENDPSYRKFMIEDEDSVVAHWLRAGADGFRLDVADELPDSFIAALRARMKAVKPDSFLIGEVWEDASNKISYGVRRRYFTGGELDSVMNYPFRTAILDFVSGRDDGSGFCRTVFQITENYPPQVLHCLMNSLSTHDTPRALSLLGAKPLGEKRERAVQRLTPQQRSAAQERLCCAAFLQYVLPGIPCIFYGDEIGTEGFEDPFCRSFFDWERVTRNPLLTFFRQLGELRCRQEALQRGTVTVDCPKPGLVLLHRTLDGVTLQAAVHIGGERVCVGAQGVSLLLKNAEREGESYCLSDCGFVLQQL